MTLTHEEWLSQLRSADKAYIEHNSLNQSNSTPLEGIGAQPLIVDDTGYFDDKCDICGDYHEAGSVPISCETGDGE